MENVYHSSKTQGLKVIEPRKSSHGKEYVYAMTSKEWSAVFLGNSYDLFNQIELSRDRQKIVITERFKNSLEVGYKSFSGSIYTLDSFNFKEGVTGWGPELVSEFTQKVLQEEKVPDALEYILQLEKEEKITIYRYPNFSDFYTEESWYNSTIDKAVHGANVSEKLFKLIENDMKKYHSEKLQDFYNKYNKN